MITRDTSFLIPLLIARLKIGYSFISNRLGALDFIQLLLLYYTRIDTRVQYDLIVVLSAQITRFLRYGKKNKTLIIIP